MDDRQSTEYVAESLVRGNRHVHTRRFSAGPHSSIFQQQSKRGSGQQDDWRFTSPRPNPSRTDTVKPSNGPAQSDFERRWSAMDFASPRDQPATEKGHPLRAISANPRMHPYRDSEGHAARSVSKSTGKYRMLDGQVLGPDGKPVIQPRPRLSETLPWRDARRQGGGYHERDPPTFLRDRDPVGWIDDGRPSPRSRSFLDMQKELVEAHTALRAKDSELKSVQDRLELYKWKERQNRNFQCQKSVREESLRRFARQQSAPPPRVVPSKPDYVSEMVESVRNQLAAGDLHDCHREMHGAREDRAQDENSLPSHISETIPNGYCSKRNLRRGISMDSSTQLDPPIFLDPSKQHMRENSIDSRTGSRQSSNPFTRTESRGDSESWKIGAQPVPRQNSFEEEFGVGELNHEEPTMSDSPFESGLSRETRDFLKMEQEGMHAKERINSSGIVHHPSWINSNFPSKKSIIKESPLQGLNHSEEVGVPHLDADDRRQPLGNHRSRSNELKVQVKTKSPCKKADICENPTHFTDAEVQAGSFERHPRENSHELEWKAEVKTLEAEVMMAMCENRELKADKEKLQASYESQRAVDNKRIRELEEEIARQQEREKLQSSTEDQRAADQREIRELKEHIAKHQEREKLQSSFWEDQRAADQKAIRELKEEIAKQQERGVQLQREADQRLKDCEKAQGEHARVSEELFHLEKHQLKHIKEQLAKTAQDRNELGSLVMERDDKLKKLTNNAEKLGQKNAELDKELGDSRWQVQSLEEDRLRLLNIIAELEKDQEMRSIEIEKLKQEKKALIAFEEKHEEENRLSQNEHAEKLEMVEKELQEALAENERAVELAVEKKDKEIATPKQELADFQATSEATSRPQMAAASTSSPGDGSKELAAEVERLKKELEKRDIERAEDQETILDLEQLQVAKAKEMEDAVRNLQNELRKKQQALDRSESLQEKLMKHHEQSPRVFTGLLEEENETLKQKLVERDMEIEAMREDHGKKSRIYDEADETIACLEADIDQWRRDFQGVCNSKMKLEQENGTMKDRLQKLSFECGGSPLKRLRELNHSLAQERQQSEVLRKTVRELQDELAEKEEQSARIEEGENPWEEG